METTVITTEPGLAPVVSHGAGVLDAVPVFGFTTAAYVVAAVLFILSLGGLSGQESAKRAIWYGIAGMALAVVATLIGPGSGNWASCCLAGGPPNSISASILNDHTAAATQGSSNPRS